MNQLDNELNSFISTGLDDLICKSMDKTKLVQKEIMVQTKHGVVRRKQWVKASEDEKKPVTPKQAEAPKEDKPKSSNSGKYHKGTDEAKAKVQELTKGMNASQAVEFAKKNGVKWAEHSHLGINCMRAKMAMAKMVEEGTLGGDKPKDTSTPTDTPATQDTYKPGDTVTVKGKTWKIVNRVKGKAEKYVAEEPKSGDRIFVTPNDIDKKSEDFSKTQNSDKKKVEPRNSHMPNKSELDNSGVGSKVTWSDSLGDSHTAIKQADGRWRVDGDLKPVSSKFISEDLEDNRNHGDQTFQPKSDPPVKQPPSSNIGDISFESSSTLNSIMTKGIPGFTRGGVKPGKHVHRVNAKAVMESAIQKVNKGQTLTAIDKQIVRKALFQISGDRAYDEILKKYPSGLKGDVAKIYMGIWSVKGGETDMGTDLVNRLYDKIGAKNGVGFDEVSKAFDEVFDEYNNYSTKVFNGLIDKHFDGQGISKVS